MNHPCATDQAEENAWTVHPAAKSSLLADLPPYIYGTTRLGDDNIPFDGRVRIARAAMDAGIWFHTSHTYGNALEVLRVAFDQARAKVPKLIVKLIGGSLDELRDVLRQNLRPLKLDSLDLGQLCPDGVLHALCSRVPPGPRHSRVHEPAGAPDGTPRRQGQNPAVTRGHPE